MAGPPLAGIPPDSVPDIIVLPIIIMVVSCAIAIGIRTTIARRAAVARKIVLFIQSSFCLLYLPSGLHLSSLTEKLPIVYRTETQKSPLSS
jgi:hypothetical protein